MYKYNLGDTVIYRRPKFSTIFTVVARRTISMEYPTLDANGDWVFTNPVIHTWAEYQLQQHGCPMQECWDSEEILQGITLGD